MTDSHAAGVTSEASVQGEFQNPACGTFGRFLSTNSRHTSDHKCSLFNGGIQRFGTFCRRRRLPSVSDCTENDDGPKTKLGRKRNCVKNRKTENETWPKLTNLQFRRRKRKRYSVGLY